MPGKRSSKQRPPGKPTAGRARSSILTVTVIGVAVVAALVAAFVGYEPERPAPRPKGTGEAAAVSDDQHPPWASGECMRPMQLMDAIPRKGSTHDERAAAMRAAEEAFASSGCRLPADDVGLRWYLAVFLRCLYRLRAPAAGSQLDGRRHMKMRSYQSPFSRRYTADIPFLSALRRCVSAHELKTTDDAASSGLAEAVLRAGASWEQPQVCCA